MKTARIVKGNKQEDIDYDTSLRKDYDDGIDLILRDTSDQIIREIQLPKDGKVFIMNNNGDTVDCIRWPPKPRKKADISEPQPQLRVTDIK